MLFMVYMIVLEYWFGDIIGWGDIGELALNSRSGSYPPLKNGGGLRPVDPPESGGNGIRSRCGVTGAGREWFTLAVIVSYRQ